ncbi:MAG: hypothetical protein Q8Q09_03080 [Deltaproteobacteria bacterium]|nr:hypothetical protein [Deltaproteobacteria bacterium]
MSHAPKARLVLSSLALAVMAACSAPSPMSDAGAEASTDGAVTEAGGDASMAMCATVMDAPMPTPLLMGMYTATTDVSAEIAATTQLGTVRGLPAAMPMGWWDAAAAMTADGSPVILLLERADRHALGAMASGHPQSLLARFRAAITSGRMATDDDGRGVARQRFEKSLLAALALNVQVAVDAAIASSVRGCARESLQHWDRVAAFYTGLDGNARTRSMTMAPDVWGTGVNNLTDENMGDLLVERLGRGRTAAMGASSRALISVGEEFKMYLTKYFFLSVMNYAYVVPSRLSMMMSATVAHAEGATFVEGLLLQLDPAGTGMGTVASRGLWAGTPDQVAQRSAMGLIIGVYGDKLARDTTGFASKTPEEQLAIAARVVGMVEALDEALVYARQDIGALRTAASTARSSASSGNAAGAMAAFAQLQTAFNAAGSYRP